MSSTALTIDDIADARAYERERDDFRSRIIELKKVRRVAVGPVVTFMFENRETIRFQIQEMARAEKLYTDEAIQTELDTYNPLLPGPGRLSASMFIELTSTAEMEEWLPKLVGIERAPLLVIGSGAGADLVPAGVDESHAANLTRQEVTAAVHFVHFSLTPSQVSRFESEPVELVFDHPNYGFRTPIAGATKASLIADFSG